jgi:TIR domain-containing protein
MLPADVELLIRDSIDVYLKAQCYRPPRFGQRLLAQSFAGEIIQPAKIAAVTAKEIEAVSSGLVTAIKNVIEKVPVNPYEGLQNDLLQVFDSEFDKCADGIRKFGANTLKRLSGKTSASSWFDDRLEDARKARHLELKLLAAELLKSDRHNIKSSQISRPTISPSVRIFISHSSTDRELAALLVDLLRSSLDLPAEAIRCTSVEGHRLAGGAETDSALRRDIRDCEAFIGLISATSIESAYVLFELGARWGAERHLLPLLAPTADAAILRGPLSGLNALRCSSAADLQQMIHEIAGLLKISVEKPAAYQRHIEQILGWGAVKTSRSESHIGPANDQLVTKESASGDEYANAQTIIEKHCEEQWPDDYSMRAFCIEQQEQALRQLRTGRPEDIPEDVFRRIRQRSAEQWPTDFSMRLFTEQEEFNSYRKLLRRRS